MYQLVLFFYVFQLEFTFLWGYFWSFLLLLSIKIKYFVLFSTLRHLHLGHGDIVGQHFKSL